MNNPNIARDSPSPLRRGWEGGLCGPSTGFGARPDGYLDRARSHFRFRRRARVVTADDLSPREVEVLQSIAGGRSNKIVADQLNICEDILSALEKTNFTEIGVFAKAS